VSTALRKTGPTKPRLQASTSRADRAATSTSKVVTVIPHPLTTDLNVLQHAHHIRDQNGHGHYMLTK
jgi:hypothetical protein